MSEVSNPEQNLDNLTDRLDLEVDLSLKDLNDEQQEKLSKALFPDTHTDEVMLCGEVRKIKPMTIKYSKMLREVSKPFAFSVVAANQSKEVIELDDDMSLCLVESAKVIAKSHGWADVLEKLDDEDVGVVYLYDVDHKNKRCYWAFYIASPNVRGKGVGSFVEYSILKHVFDDMQMNKLCAEVLAFNEPVTNMHKGFGFKEQGYFPQHIFKGGKYEDIVCVAMLKEDWNVKKGEIEERLRKKNLIK